MRDLARLDRIFVDLFHELRCERDDADCPVIARRFSWLALAWYVAIPASLGVWLGHAMIPGVGVLTVTAAVASITAAVLTSLLPMTRQLIELVPRRRVFEYVQRKQAEEAWALYGAIASLYAPIAFGILVSLASLLPQLVLLIDPSNLHPLAPIVASSCLWACGFVIVTVLVRVVAGMYLILSVENKKIEDEIRHNIQSLDEAIEESMPRDESERFSRLPMTAAR